MGQKLLLRRHKDNVQYQIKPTKRRHVRHRIRITMGMLVIGSKQETLQQTQDQEEPTTMPMHRATREYHV